MMQPEEARLVAVISGLNSARALHVYSTSVVTQVSMAIQAC